MSRARLAISVSLALIVLGAGGGSPGRAQDADRETIDTLVGDLAADDIPLNASNAIRSLLKTRRAAVPALEVALDSPDFQQRQLAAWILSLVRGTPPTIRLIEVLVEGLKDDCIPQEHRGKERIAYAYVGNATGAINYLLRNVVEAEPQLEEGLRSRDGQQKFLCAYILARGRRGMRIATIAPILIEHLKDNKISNDACMSSMALYRLGPPVEPYLRAVLESEDKQQRETALLILKDLKAPPKTREDLRERKASQSISGQMSDPPTQYMSTWLDPRQKWGPEPRP